MDTLIFVSEAEYNFAGVYLLFRLEPGARPLADLNVKLIDSFFPGGEKTFFYSHCSKCTYGKVAMIVLLKIFAESVSQALQQLRGNKLRSFLSLLGISIGIFCIVGVLAAVDSLEDNVRGSVEKLGDDVVYIQKIKWGDHDGDWQRYLRRPNISYDDFEVVKTRVRSADISAYVVGLGARTLKYRSNSVEGVSLEGISYDFGELFKLTPEKGRYFSPAEYYFGTNKVILGHDVAEELFGPLEPVGKTVKMSGHQLDIIGVLEKSGDDLISVMDFDESVIISYELARKIANLKPSSPWGNSSIMVKAAGNASLQQLKDEVTGILRAQRRLKPREEDNFSLNTLSIISNALNDFFGVLNMLGIFIGGFAILVGIFSVANIMFVSVKERTSIVGVKKALGAKRYMILLEFLVESVILCLFGGAAGLAIVYLCLQILTGAIDFDLNLSASNILLGVSLSAIVGVLAGMVPAVQASRMDPVEAMRK